MNSRALLVWIHCWGVSILRDWNSAQWFSCSCCDCGVTDCIEDSRPSPRLSFDAEECRREFRALMFLSDWLAFCWSVSLIKGSQLSPRLPFVSRELEQSFATPRFSPVWLAWLDWDLCRSRSEQRWFVLAASTNILSPKGTPESFDFVIVNDFAVVDLGPQVWMKSWWKGLQELILDFAMDRGDVSC